MKKIYTVLILISIVFFAISTYSQNANKQVENTKMLIGTWKLDTMKFENFEFPEEYLPLVQERYQQMKDSTLFIFNEDRTYFSSGVNAESHGTWRITSDGKYILVRIKGSEKEEKSKIKSISNSKLIMIPMQESASNSEFILKKSD